MSFVHLHNHTVYSLLDGLVTPEALASGAESLGHKAVAITDHGSITGHLRFVRACRGVGIKPILGIEAYHVDDVTEKKKGESRLHITLIAKNDAGWGNLCRLMTEAHRNFYYRPRIDFTMLRDMDDIIVMTGCMNGLLSHPNWKRVVENYSDRFGDRFFLEIMPIRLNEQNEINKRALHMGSKYGIGLVVTNDTHYLKPEDQTYHSFLLDMNTGGKLEFDIDGLYLRDTADMIAVCDSVFSSLEFPREFIDEALDNTVHIADNTDIQLEEREITLPKVVEGDPADTLRKKTEKKLKALLISTTDGNRDLIRKYTERYNMEIEVIREKGFSDYFLLVEDMVTWAKNQDMELDPGRGSAGGSLVSYLLGITGVDPIKDGLLFERFLNPERTDYPDIDIDFPQSRRKEVLDYLKDKYGHDRVANISTLSKLRAKSAFKDVAKFMDIPFELANQFTSLLEGVTSIKEEIGESNLLKRTLMGIEGGDLCVDYADGITGTLRHGSKHAAGIVISPVKIENSAVLEKKGEDFCVNWEMDDVSYLGWLKVDVLGLRSLDVIKEAKRLIYERHREEIDWDEVEVRDPKYFREFGYGNTVGMFQYESIPMTRICRNLDPIEDHNTLVHINALGRPGPLDSGMTEQYIVRYKAIKKGGGYFENKKDKPYAPYTKEICGETFNVILYQEQIMQIAVELAGYTVGESDVLRKVVAKSKGKEEFAVNRNRFVKGCVEKSKMTPGVAESLFNALENYSRYSFNKAHAVAYTELALRQMYLKVNYPAEYMAALYTCTSEQEKRMGFLAECKRIGIPVRVPDINVSQDDFILRGDDIYVGLGSVKGLGNVAVSEILSKREAGEFSSIQDFRVRVTKKSVNKRVLSNLVMAGAFDKLIVNHKKVVDNIEWFGAFYDWTVGRGKKSFDPTPPTNFYSLDGNYSQYQIDKERSTLLEGVFSISAIEDMRTQVPRASVESLREVILYCQKCELFDHYKRPVPFDCNNPGLMIIGEAPGEKETDEELGFVGKAGVMLFSKLHDIGIKREDCHVTNVYKCRPLENKLPYNPPTDCHAYLVREIELVKPKLIFALGGTALAFFRKKKGGISTLAERMEVCVEKVGEMSVPVLYCVHPAALLHPDPEGERERIFDLVIQRLKEIKEGIRA